MIFTADEVLLTGLQVAGFDLYRQNKVCRTKNIERFKGCFGSPPMVYAQIWEDLVASDNQAARIDPKKLKLKSFLLSLYFLRCYPTEKKRSGEYNICEETARKWSWYVAEKNAALKEQKVCCC